MTRSRFPIALASRIAWREARASASRFVFVVLAVALGVGALTGVRGFSRAFRNMLLTEARTLMAADLTVRIFGNPGPEQEQAITSLRSRGVKSTLVLETLTMVNAPSSPDPVLVSIKAVDPELYPFYGEPVLDPAGTVRSALQPGNAILSPDLFDRLRVKTGELVRVGGVDLRVAAAMSAEPDRMSGSFNVGPRLVMNRKDLDRTGLISLGTRAAERFLFALSPQSPPVGKVRDELNKAFPEARVIDYRETNPQITQGLERATTFLSLITLIALIVGALGVGTAMHAHLQQKLDSIAIMKSLGARSSQIIRIYVLQTLMLGSVGALLGILAGFIVQAAFPILIVRYFQIQPHVELDVLTAVQGLIVGLATTLLFTLPPLAGIRRVKPNLIFRRDMPEVRVGLAQRWRNWSATIVSGVLILAGVFVLASWLVSGEGIDPPRVAAWFVAGVAVSLILLTGVAWTLIRALRAVVARVRLSPAVRHGIANVYRPGSQAPAILTALGVGVMFTLTVFLLQRSLLKQIATETPPGMPNVFMLDITPQQQPEVFKMLQSYAGSERKPEIISTVSARLLSVDGKPVDPRFTRTRAIATSPDLGTLEAPEASVSDRAARQFGIKQGSTLEWNAYGRTIKTMVRIVHRPEQNRISGMVDFRLTDKPLANLPTVLYGAVRVPDKRISALQRDSYARFPTITVINMSDIMARIEDVIGQISLVVRFLSGFTILAGSTILASSIAGTRFRRIREVVILKTLGATRPRIIRIFSIEFAILGLVAGLIGSLLASGFSAILLKRLLNVPVRLDWWPNAAAILLTAGLSCLTGWLASWKILGEKPLAVLRDE